MLCCAPETVRSLIALHTRQSRNRGSKQCNDSSTSLLERNDYCLTQHVQKRRL
jgi:hypothetical protein